MTNNATNMRGRAEQINELLEELVRYAGEQEDLTKDFAEVLHLIIPGDGDRLLSLGDWGYSPALETEITGWLAGSVNRLDDSRPFRRKVFMDEDRIAEVHAQHLLDDHWRISVFKIVYHEADEEFTECPEFPEGHAGLKPAMAVARIVGSGALLARTGAESARHTQSGVAVDPNQAAENR